jgi:hypothetical protein
MSKLTETPSPDMPALSEEELLDFDTWMSTRAMPGSAAREAWHRIRDTARRSRQPAGGTYVERAREWLRSFAPRVALGDDGSDGMYHEEDYQSLARLLEATERAAVEKAAKGA